MDIGILIAYFAKQDEARKALRGLARHGFSRTALVYKDDDGDIHSPGPLLWRRALWVTLLAILLAISIILFLQWRHMIPDWQQTILLPLLIIVCFSSSALAALFWLRQFRYNVGPAVINNYSRSLMSGESLLILQAPCESLARPLTLLRESADISPVLFVMHPRQERRAEARGPEVKLLPAQVLEHAQRHAREQKVEELRPQGNAVLLKRFTKSRAWVHHICTQLAAASRLEQKSTPAADWILDNEYILESNARAVLANLPRRYYQQLPILASEPYRGMPCIYGLAKDLVSHTEMCLNRENILAYIEAYQSVRPLTIGELWAIPQMLRFALIESIQSLAVTALADLREHQLADFWANRLIAANRRDSNQLFTILSELAKAEPHPTPYFGAQLVGLLYDEAAALAPIKNWLERTLKVLLPDLHRYEMNRQTREQLASGNAFTSLRQLAMLDWRDIFEQLSRVEQVLRHDPAGIYPQMDFLTRDRCRRAIEELARIADLSEEYLAERVIKLAATAQQETINDEKLRHVGTWLIGTARAELARQFAYQETRRYRILAWIYCHHTAIYTLGITGFTAFFMFLIIFFGLRPLAGQTGALPAVFVGLFFVLLIPVSQLAIQLVNYLITRLLPPIPLPKMDFEDTGIPDAFRTLVVVPMLLVNTETIRAEAEKLEIRYLANRDENLFFSLFSDYTDSDTSFREEDTWLLQTAVTCIEELNQRHEGERFFLFHRERSWSDSEQKFIGWERKRGKLEELNRLIDGTRPETAPPLVYVGDPDRLADIRFLITLDSDTHLPHASARRMVETLAHPLNQPCFDEAGKIMAGYTIIQPRVSPTLPSTNGSIFSRLFSDAVGVDPYTQLVSDVYQDLSGEGSYHGKGIYDVRAFSRILSGRLPAERVLSHDLLEGSYVRVALASDIELYDDFPLEYQKYNSRAHRWIRGDWQIAGWLLPRLTQPAGTSEANPLSMLNRWKILDNLRRSLLPAASLALLLVAWLVSFRTGVIASLVVGLQLFFQPLTQPLTMATTSESFKYFSPTKLLHDLLRACADAALLPQQALLTLDAIIRACYRNIFSNHLLLEWTAQTSHWWNVSRQQPLFVVSMAIGSIFSLMVGWSIWQIRPDNLTQAAPWLILWLFSPLLVWVLNLQPIRQQQTQTLPEMDRRFLRQVARRTWRYFSSFVSADTLWLPPDNYQVAHQDRLAMRTSPTNIGLWMTSTLGAHDAGYLTIHQVIELLTSTMDTINRLERYKGHLLNWYDIQTMVPLEPRYVSAVDSGNLLGALWTLEKGLDELIHGPLLDGKAFAGLADTGEILKKHVALEGITILDRRSLEQLLTEWNAAPATIIELLRLQRRTEVNVKSVSTAAGVIPWAAELKQQAAAWGHNRDSFLSWIEILAEKTEAELAILGPVALLAIKQDLSRPPSLHDLAQNQINSILILTAIREENSLVPPVISAWIDRVRAAFVNAQWLAGETLGKAERLLDRIREFSAELDMRFLYDSKRKLFAIGFNVSTDLLDGSSYDLLASEARLGSFIAIARGDVPIEHWFSMNRPYGALGNRRVLLSWAGTMFEYLMPLLFQRSYDNSLLDKAAREAVTAQIAYGRKRHVPWGISESAFANMDLNKTYQYKAFGVPALGLKRGLEEQLVIAPYATLLALNVAPQETMKNLKLLAGLGMLGDYGYFEAMDFSRQTQREGKHGVIIKAYMAHHHGMAFLALINFLHDNPFPRRFHSDTRVRAFELLLQERIPILPALHISSTRQSEPVLHTGELITPTGSTFTTPHTATPKTLLLSNGRYDLMVTNSGGGYSQWTGQELTRWRSDPTCDAMGFFCYLYEAEQNHLWSTTYHPVGGEVTQYAVDFTRDRAIFRRDDNGVHTETEVIVSPEDDVEVRRITLINHSAQVRRLDLTTYVELSMAPHNADRQHPAFNKLFIQTEALEEQQALLAFRRPRSDNELPLFVGHRLILQHTDGNNCPLEDDWQFETDRRRFIGRGRTMANPMGAMQDLGNNQGFVLEPSLSLRHNITLEPGQRLQLSLLLAAGSSREQVMLLMAKYCEPQAVTRAMDFAWGSAQQELQMLHIQPDEARRFQKLASHLLFPNSNFRAPGHRLAENRKGQAGLWPYGISGDLPITLVTIGKTWDISLARQMLQAHTYWRMHGLSTDLVILNEEAGGYERPLMERLERLIQANAVFNRNDQPGGVFLRNAAVIPEEDLKLFKFAASIVLVAARGTLPRQLGIPVEVHALREKVVLKRVASEPSAPLPFMELHYFNSLGGFTPDGREYAIYLGPETNTPAPWVNVMANPTFGTMVSETGTGFTWYGNSQRNRLTGWSNDPVLDPASEALYLRDEESGMFWSPTAAPIRENTAYRARHGAGYSVFEHNSNGIEQELTVFVPVDDNGGQPIKLQRLRLKNASHRSRRLSLTYYVELILGENRETSQMHVITNWDDETRALLAQNFYHSEYPERVAFVALTPSADSYGGDRTAFIGRNRSLANPAAMELIHLSERTGAGLDPCAALRINVELAPGEHREIICMLGQAGSVDQARQLVLRFQEDLAFDETLAQTKSWWDALLGTIEVHTPDLAADLLINRWLQYQSLSCRLWARSAFYQSGGAFGFRDQLQDVLAFLYSRPQLARDQILLAASRQFQEGDVQHWWHEPTGAGIRSRFSDDLLWLPYVVGHYVRTTGDLQILQVEVPFLKAPLLTDEQHEVFSIPEVTLERATLFEHCRRAVSRGLTIGPHGLPLIGTGDWNDGLNLVGAEGRGESVWLGWFLCDLLQGMVEMSSLLQQPEMSLSYQEDRSALIERIEKAGWDGEWYLRGTFDDGTPLGSAGNLEARIDSLPQSWAWLCGAADPQRAEQGLESAWQHLVRQDERLVLLFTPPFDKSEPSPGYIRSYPPGVRENGGQYTHAGLWMAMAMARKKDGERAVQLLRILNPIENARDATAVWHYGVEPYVVAADVYRLPGRIGQGGWTWYTGSAAWMYRVWVEEVLGLKIRHDRMQINPVIPATWEGFSLRYQHDGMLYQIQVENPDHCACGVAWVEMDGQRLADGFIPLEKGLLSHHIIVRMGDRHDFT